MLMIGMLVMAVGMVQAQATKPVTIELWYGAAITEAGPPPDDWVVYKIVRDKLNIDLKITALPSSESDQTTKILAAAAANQLPDIFMVQRTPWLKLIQQGLLAGMWMTCTHSCHIELKIISTRTARNLRQ